MDRRFDMGDFEQSLKDHADQFKMVPSKRVWNGIYNNLHPGSRWPSITVAIAFIITIITLGNLNNSSSVKMAENSPELISHSITPKNNLPVGISAGNNNSKSIPGKRDESQNRDLLTLTSEKQPDISFTQLQNQTGTTSNKDLKISRDNKSAVPGSQNQLAIISFNNTREPGINKLNSVAQGTNSSQLLSLYSPSENLQQLSSTGDDNLYDLKKENGDVIENHIEFPFLVQYSSFITPSSTSLKFNNSHNSTIAQSESSSQKARIPHKKRNSKSRIIYYVTASATTATFRGRSLQPPTGQGGVSPFIQVENQPTKDMIYNARLGFEAGGLLEYQLSKKWKFLTGLGFSYSGYNIISNPIHPTSSSLVLKSENTGTSYLKTYVTRYANNGMSNNQSTLNNYTLQLGIPVGLEYTFWKNKKMEINVQSTLQPFMLLKSNAYLISSDGRFYIQDPSLQRKLNITGTFEPYISFNARKIKWHLGPQLRYNLLSTYKNNYSIKEHMLDYGIKIGISK